MPTVIYKLISVYLYQMMENGYVLYADWTCLKFPLKQKTKQSKIKKLSPQKHQQHCFDIAFTAVNVVLE